MVLPPWFGRRSGHSLAALGQTTVGTVGLSDVNHAAVDQATVGLVGLMGLTWIWCT